MSTLRLTLARLPLARFNWPLALWVVCALLAGLLYLALVPIHLNTVVAEDKVRQGYLALQPALSLRTFGNLVAAGRYAVLLVFLAMAALIVWRRPGDRLGLIAALMLLTLPLATNLVGPSDNWQRYSPAWRPVLAGAAAFIVVGPGLSSTLAFFFLFPTGRAEPRWLGWVGGGLMLAVYALGLVSSVFPAWEMGELAFGVGVVIILGLLVLALGGQAYRYRRVSAPAERRQTWLVVLGLFGFVLGLGIVASGLLGGLVGLVAELLTLLVLPVSLGVAILRYGLWDIEVIVRRTLIYTVLTGLLALTYFGAVVLLQSLVRLFTGQSQSPLVSVVSTLTIAALFVPLRRRVQAQVDRRFYRRKYDAAQIVAAFGSALRTETALEQVTAQLVNVAAATVQPSHVSVWLPRAQPARRPAERPE